jgi:AraC-like DNA-binding protein/ligand-binding sensor protein
MNAPHSTPADLPRHRTCDVIARLQQSTLFREYKDAFETATGLPLVLRRAGAFDAPMQGSKKIANFCSLMEGKNGTCAGCFQLQAEIECGPAGGCRTLQCFAGLSESVVPVHVGENIVGYLQTGQIFLQKPTEKKFQATLLELEKWRATVDVAQLRHAFFETRVLPKARYGAVLRLLSSFAQHLSLLTNELVIQQAAAEPPSIGRARDFIAAHLADELSLRDVARAAHMSPFYFCKIFKGATGLTFTDYLGRARVEKTKELLLNPNTRISEAAFAVGFQSLSQFNRVFRRITGESPTHHREHGAGSQALLATAA